MSPATAAARAQARMNTQLHLADITPYFQHVKVGAAMQPIDKEMPELMNNNYDVNIKSKSSNEDNSTSDYRSQYEQWLQEQANVTQPLNFPVANLIKDSPYHEAQIF